MNRLKVATVAALLVATCLTSVWFSADSSADGGIIRGEGHGDGIDVVYHDDSVPYMEVFLDPAPEEQVRVLISHGSHIQDVGPVPPKGLKIIVERLEQGTYSVLVNNFKTGDKVADCQMTVCCYHVVSFQSNGGTGSMDPAYVADSSAYTIPGCGFSAPSGKEFDRWISGSETLAPGDQVTVSADMVLVAQYSEGGSSPVWIYIGMAAGLLILTIVTVVAIRRHAS